MKDVSPAPDRNYSKPPRPSHTKCAATTGYHAPRKSPAKSAAPRATTARTQYHSPRKANPHESKSKVSGCDPPSTSCTDRAKNYQTPISQSSAPRVPQSPRELPSPHEDHPASRSAAPALRARKPQRAASRPAQSAP